jgi:hypothetical protein
MLNPVNDTDHKHHEEGGALSRHCYQAHFTQYSTARAPSTDTQYGHPGDVITGSKPRPQLFQWEEIVRCMDFIHNDQTDVRLALLPPYPALPVPHLLHLVNNTSLFCRSVVLCSALSCVIMHCHTPPQSLPCHAMQCPPHFVSPTLRQTVAALCSVFPLLTRLNYK